MNNIVESLISFCRSDLRGYKNAAKHGRPDLIMVSKNGEVCWNDSDKNFVVFDETYTDIICITPYRKLVVASLEWYFKEVLGD